jgi:hypothetical protein
MPNLPGKEEGWSRIPLQRDTFTQQQYTAERSSSNTGAHTSHEPGCPIFGAFMFLRLGWDSSIYLQLFTKPTHSANPVSVQQRDKN